MSTLDFQQVPTDPEAAARLAVEALKLARECLKVAKAPKALARTRLALSSADGAVRATSYRKNRAAEVSK